MISPSFIKWRQTTYVLRNHIQKYVHTSQTLICEAKKNPGDDADVGKESNQTFKEKGFGFPSDYLKKRDLPSFSDLKEKGLKALLPAYIEVQQKVKQNFPNNLNEAQQLLQGFTPFLKTHYEKGRKAMPDVNAVKETPIPIFAFGCAGAFPFILPTWRCMAAGAILPGWEFMQLAYGACILSFVGGIRWGCILQKAYSKPPPPPQQQQPSSPYLDSADLGISVVPPILGLCALSLPPLLGNLIIMSSLATAAYIDLTSAGYPEWYKVFRMGLTGIAIFSLLFMLLLKVCLPRKICS